MLTLALFLLPLIHSANADAYVVGFKANIAENNVMLLAAPEDLWFSGNGGGAVTFESHRTRFMDSNSRLALSAGWNHHGGFTFEGNWRIRDQFSSSTTLVADLVGFSIGSGILSPNDEKQLMFMTGGGIEIPVIKGVDVQLIGKVGMGTARDDNHDWFITNTTSIYLGASHDF
ncbi:MAG: hypothetical protein WCT28_02280 [Patescibacteria group bacterium]